MIAYSRTWLSSTPPPAPRTLSARTLSPPLQAVPSTPSPRAPPPPVSLSPVGSFSFSGVALLFHARLVPPTPLVPWSSNTPDYGRLRAERFSLEQASYGEEVTEMASRRPSGNSWRRSCSRLSANYFLSAPAHDTYTFNRFCQIFFPPFLSLSLSLCLASSFFAASSVRACEWRKGDASEG